MKVSIGMNLRSEAWGGGNQVGNALAKGLSKRGMTISFDLHDPDLDIILLADPRYELKITAYTHHDVLNYLRTVNPNAITVYRINDCDERKGEKDKFNPLAREAASVVDVVVWAAYWLRNLHVQQGMQPQQEDYIFIGVDHQIFHPSGYKHWNKQGKLKLVTHHWAGLWSKGFDIYQELDHMLLEPAYKNRLDFTYIGNVPENFRFQNATHLPPASGHQLADLLRSHHVYITGSYLEPMGSHHVEGANCGLPILYRDSGGPADYAKGFGIGFTPENFREKLEQMFREYDHWADQMPNYPYTDQRMVDLYEQLFCNLVDKRDEIIAQRPWQATIPTIQGDRVKAIGWLENLRPHLLRFLQSVKGETVGQFRIASQGLTPEGEHIQLPWSVWALKIYYMLGAWDDLPQAEQTAWINTILGFQVAGNPQFLAWGKNAFRDPALMHAVQNQTRRMKRWKNRFSSHPTPQALALSAETKQAIATLQEIGIQTPLPYQGFPQTEKALKQYLNALDWSKPWMSGAHLATLAVFYATEAPRFLPVDQIQNLNQICGAFIQNLADPITGAYFGAEKPPYGELVNGAMKILTALDWFEVPIHYPEQLIDTVLSEYPQAEGCHLVDAVYVLYRCHELSDYRQADIQNYCLKLIDLMQAHFNPIDGGFSYYIGRSQSHIHHVRVTRQRPVSDLHGTLLLTWAASMILHLMGQGDGWRVLRP